MKLINNYAYAVQPFDNYIYKIDLLVEFTNRLPSFTTTLSVYTNNPSLDNIINDIKGLIKGKMEFIHISDISMKNNNELFQQIVTEWIKGDI